MNTNDNILTRMIEKDLLARKAENYQLKDEVAVNPQQIKVGANEAVYVCYCYVESSGSFTIKIESGTDLVEYQPLNTYQRDVAGTSIYDSPQITVHWSNVKITAQQTSNFFIRYIRVTIHKFKNNSHEKES